MEDCPSIVEGSTMHRFLVVNPIELKAKEFVDVFVQRESLENGHEKQTVSQGVFF